MTATAAVARRLDAGILLVAVGPGVGGLGVGRGVGRSGVGHGIGELGVGGPGIDGGRATGAAGALAVETLGVASAPLAVGEQLDDQGMGTIDRIDRTGVRDQEMAGAVGGNRRRSLDLGAGG
jgi:hypothetical protein